jgi:hypothetical protein
MSKEADEAQRIDISKEEKPIIIQPIDIIETKDNSNSDAQELTIPKKTVLLQVIIPKEEKIIETHYMNIVQQETETTHYKVFQEKTMSLEQFTKETTFTDNNATNPDNRKQFERW